MMDFRSVWYHSSSDSGRIGRGTQSSTHRSQNHVMTDRKPIWSAGQWLNPPAEREQVEATLRFRVERATDFWRKTHDGGIRDNGHFLFTRVAGDFTAAVKFTADYRDLYDQAGLMVRLDEANWLKCGVEYVDGEQLASVVVTRDWSDWSVMPIGDPSEVWFKLRRRDETFEIEFALDGESYRPLRQAFLTDASALEVGIMACAPQGGGFTVMFDDLQLESGPVA